MKKEIHENQFYVRRLQKAVHALAALCLVLFCLSHCAAQENSSKEKLRVLFIGNSLTYVNNLPEIVRALADSAKEKRKFSFKIVAYPDYSLEDHWNKGDAVKALKKDKWDFVVMQQGPSAGREGREILIDYARKFAEEIRKTGGKPALYMVWDFQNQVKDFAGVSRSYSAAAKEVNGLFLPAGEAWLEAWRLDPKMELYSPDGLHPNAAGSYLAALVIYQQLYNASPVGLSSNFILRSGEEVSIPKKTAAILQQAAAETNKKFGVAQ